MAWNEAVITNAGMSLLAEGITGKGIAITRAAGGEDISDTASLLAMTQIRGTNHPLNIAKKETESGRITVNVRVQNAGSPSGYRLRQIGLFARFSEDKDEKEVLFSVIQDKEGEVIPPEEENPEFLVEFDFVIPISNSERTEVTVTPGTFVTQNELTEMRDRAEWLKEELSAVKNRQEGAQDNIENTFLELEEHRGNDIVHISKTERTSWNAKAEGNHSHMNANQSAAGFMSAADKNKLDSIATGANSYIHPASPGNRHIPSGGSSGQILRWSEDGKAVWGADNNTVYSNMKGATADTQGISGLVPAPSKGNQGKFLRGDGTWQTPVYPAATQSSSGLMSAADKKKLDGVSSGANAYAHPSGSGSRHIPSGGSSGQILRWSGDGTAAWGPDNNTTYTNMEGASASAAGKTGLVPAPSAGKQASYLRGDGQWAVPPDTKYTHPATAGNKHIPAGGSTNQILAYSAAGTAKWSDTCNAAAIDIVQGTKNLAWTNIAYKPGRTKALVECWTVPSTSSDCCSGYISFYLTGLSGNMTAVEETTVSGLLSVNSGIKYKISAGGTISIGGHTGGYRVTWFN